MSNYIRLTWGIPKEMLTKVKMQQDGLIALVKQDYRCISNNNAAVRTTAGIKMRIGQHLQERRPLKTV